MVRALGLLFGVAALLAGVIGLERVFILERDDALEAVARQRAVLRSYVAMDLEERCRDDLELARLRIGAALRDPLIDGSKLIHVEGTRQRLPRQFSFASSGSTRAEELYRDLMSREPMGQALDRDDPWLGRLHLFASFRRALESGYRDAIERSVRAILTHRARFIAPAANDIPYMIALLTSLERASSAAPELMHVVLRDGLTDSRGVELPGLQRQLLDNRGLLSRDDFDFLATRLLALSETSGVRHDDFEVRVRDESAPTIGLPANVVTPMIANGGAWLIDGNPDGLIQGMAIELDGYLVQTEAEMKARGLLEADDTLVLDAPAESASRFAGLGIAIESPRWESSRQAIERRFWLKSSLAVTLVVLLLGAGAIRWAWSRRERQLLALKSDFVATVSHELRTPLASMRLMVETLERRLGGKALARDYPERILREIDSLDFLVENILSFNRLEKGRVEPRVEDVRLSDIVQSLERDLQGATRARVHVRFDGERDLVLRADPELVKLLFLNLGTNACKYNDDDPVAIQIEADAREAVVIRMADNGTGIPEDQFENVFSEFYRADTTSRGFGLGLAICRRIMNLHAGDIRVAASSASGTVFELSFP